MYTLLNSAPPPIRCFVSVNRTSRVQGRRNRGCRVRKFPPSPYNGTFDFIKVKMTLYVAISPPIFSDLPTALKYVLNRTTTAAVTSGLSDSGLPWHGTPDFGRSVNPISTRRGKLYPPHYYLAPPGFQTLLRP